VKIGTPFSDVQQSLWQLPERQQRQWCGGGVQAEGSQHISYAFTGHWSGPEELMPPTIR
jgi:hypothetical protein